MRHVHSASCLAATLLVASIARAQGPVDDGTRSSARQLGEEAGSLFAAGDYAAALDRYNRAEALVHVPTLGVRAARCLVRLGRLVEANERYLAVTRVQLPADAPAVHQEALRDAEKERDALLLRIPAVVIQIVGSADGVAVILDGRPVPPALLGVKRLVDPGAHTVEVRRADQSVSRPFTAREGEVVPLSVQPPAALLGPAAPAGSPSPPLAPAPPARPGTTSSTQRTVGFVALGLGGAGLAVGAITGGLVAAKHGSLVTECGAGLDCMGSSGSTRWNDAEGYNRLRTLSTASFVAGGVLVAAGVVLVLTAPSAKASGPERAVTAWIGAGSAGLRGEL